MKKKLSICIFAYQQQEQIKAHLDELALYEEDDIEVVVSDDTTDDSIETLVLSYAGDRFRYVKNEFGAGADGNYLNAIISAESDYVWIFRSSDISVVDCISEVVKIVYNNPECTLYFVSSVSGEGLMKRKYPDEICKEVWHSGTLHPSGYVINKKYCDFDLYKSYIKKYFDDYKASNVAFSLLQADLGLKGNTCFSKLPAWKYKITITRNDKAVNAPDGKNPFALEFEYKRYALMFDYASSISDEKIQNEFIEKVIHTYAKQILHIFGKRNSNEEFLKHYGCESVKFSSHKEFRVFIDATRKNLEMQNLKRAKYIGFAKKEAFIYAVIKPAIYKIKNK